MKELVPCASSPTPVICRARPPRVTTTEPKEGCEVASAVSTSPSESESFCKTGRSVDFPGRTPKSSSTAVGGVFFSLRCGSLICSSRSGLDSSDSTSLASGLS